MKSYMVRSKYRNYEPRIAPVFVTGYFVLKYNFSKDYCKANVTNKRNIIHQRVPNQIVQFTCLYVAVEKLTKYILILHLRTDLVVMTMN